MRTVIMTDSTCDMSAEEYSELQVETVPLSVIFGDRVYRDGVDITKEKFFNMLETDENYPTTSQPSPEDFEKAFRPHCRAGEEVVYIGISSAISGTHQSAEIGRKFCEKGKIYVIDSQLVTAPMSILVRYACALRDEGMSGREIAKRVEEKKGKVKVYAVMDTLKYLVRGGRVPATVGKVGGMLCIKPMVTLKDGGVCPYSYARGQARGIEKLVEQIKSDDIDADMPIRLINSNAPERMAEMEKTFRKNGISYNWIYASIGSVIGAHLGPGAVGITYFLK